jgi:penicillin-binding protein 1C
MHETVRVDRRNGLRAGPACPPAFVAERTFERYDEETRAWASAAGRTTAPEQLSPLCPGVPEPPGAAWLRIGWPGDGAEFVLDPERPQAQQQLSVRVDAPRGVDRVDLLVDGRRVARVGSPFVARWGLTPGEHVLVARGEGGAESPPVSLRVR